ncbi:12736_t:CDS:1, partial [Acaulospora colombiana]
MVAALITRNLSRLTPREVVKVPEGIGGQDKVPNGKRNQVDQHPSDVGDLTGCDHDEETGQTQDDGEEDKWNHRILRALDSGYDDEIDGERDSGREDQSTSQLHEHDKLHGETEGTAQVSD